MISYSHYLIDVGGKALLCIFAWDFDICEQSMQNVFPERRFKVIYSENDLTGNSRSIETTNQCGRKTGSRVYCPSTLRPSVPTTAVNLSTTVQSSVNRAKRRILLVRWHFTRCADLQSQSPSFPHYAIPLSMTPAARVEGRQTADQMSPIAADQMMN